MSESAVDPIRAITDALSAPFDPAELKWKPAVVKGDRALALVYIDARVVQDRLDAVLGPAGWQDEYEFLADGSVLCKLRLRIGAEWITKMDVGGQSEQPDEGDRHKAAVSDALKRAAVKFGIGRYLYRMPQQWCDYDSQKRQFKRTPQVPASAMPAPAPHKQQSRALPTHAEKPNGKPKQPKPPEPKTGQELANWLAVREAEMVHAGLCGATDLAHHVVREMGRVGHTGPMVAWPHQIIPVAVGLVREFYLKAKARKQAEADGDPEPISDEQVKHLRIELERTRAEWEECCAWLGRPTETTLAALTADEARRLLAKLAGVGTAETVS